MQGGIGASASKDTEAGQKYSAWALREVDEGPVILFLGVNVLDLSSLGESMFVSASEGND